MGSRGEDYSKILEKERKVMYLRVENNREYEYRAFSRQDTP
jgi:hypothetical protein